MSWLCWPQLGALSTPRGVVTVRQSSCYCHGYFGFIPPSGSLGSKGNISSASSLQTAQKRAGSRVWIFSAGAHGHCLVQHFDLTDGKLCRRGSRTSPRAGPGLLPLALSPVPHDCCSQEGIGVRGQNPHPRSQCFRVTCRPLCPCDRLSPGGWAWGLRP